MQSDKPRNGGTKLPPSALSGFTVPHADLADSMIKIVENGSATGEIVRNSLCGNALNSGLKRKALFGMA